MLTTIKLKLKTKRFTKSSRKRFEKLKDARTAEVFQAKVDGKFAALCILDGDIGTLANRLKEGLLATAGGVLWKQDDEDSTLGSKRSSGSVRSEIAAETEVHER